jgi:hypothetical protein
MSTRSNLFLAGFVVAIGILQVCPELDQRVCASAATTEPSTSPSIKTQEFRDKAAGVHFNYPAGWTSPAQHTSLLNVIDPVAADDGASLSLDVPSLPRFLPPGMPTPKMVENGYVKDLKKQMHDAKVDESVEIKVPDSSARRVKCSGHENGKVSIDVAIIIVHAGRVYIFSCDSDEAGYPAARAALDNAVASMQWIK